jgi:paraquat-inducible protein A
LVIAAAIFYIPANVLSITTVVSFGSTQSDTILSGVLYFIKTGMWPIAIIIFIASIVVPLAKILILSFLMITVQLGSVRHRKDRTRLYRITEAIGRWSMLDIFVVTILVALVNLGSLATVKAGPAAPFFAAVVVITMFAAMSFDPRLIWDAKEYPDGK